MVYIIADAGVNWRNLNEADRLIKECARAGVHAVKFQAYEPFIESQPAEKIEVFDHSTTRTDKKYITVKNAVEGHPHATHLNRIALTPDSIAYLYYRCMHHGVDFMCTPMYPEAVPMLQPYVRLWKVRFADRGNLEILKLIYSSGKKVLISTDKVGSHPNAYYLFCIPEYPPKSFPPLNSFDGFDGYSCHIPVVSHLLDVLIKKPRFLEVHVMLDCYENYEPIDQKVSLTITDLHDILLSSRQGGLLEDPNAWV